MRDNTVTISKAIAIILMVMAHARCPLILQQYINMFHMPLFLFMSGYCFKESHLLDAKGFMLKRVETVYWPFVKWSLVFLLFHNLFFSIGIYNEAYPIQGAIAHMYSIKEMLMKAIFIVFTMSGVEQLLGGFWFLKALFFGNIIFFLTLKYIPLKFAWGGVILTILTILALYTGVHIPILGIGYRDLMAALFIWVGYSYHKIDIHVERNVGVITVCAVSVALGTKYWQCSMLSLKWNLVAPYIVTAIAGTLMTFGISHHINKIKPAYTKWLKTVGDKTLIILTWHFLSFKLVSILLIMLYRLPMVELAEFPVIEEYALAGWWVTYLVVGVSFPLLISMIHKR